MLVKKLLTQLNLGTSVAEFDEDLESYFVETNVFREFVRDRVDIVAGDKGTGKTAIYRFINKRQKDISELENVIVVPAFNPSGSPIFKKLAETDQLSEQQYGGLWKAYILALAGNTLIQEDPLQKGSKLDKMLKGLGLTTPSVTPKGAFTKILSLFPKFLNWKSAEVQFSLTEAGLPSFTPKIEFNTDEAERKGVPEIEVSAEDAFSVLNDAIGESQTRMWITFDRLDEAFHGSPEIEVLALRALLRTYLDLTEFENLKLKLFLRRDLFRRITAGGFVNLTHVNAKKIEIIWDEEDLLSLLSRRVRENKDFMKELDANKLSDKDLFDTMFPDQVDYGLRKPKTWVWVMRRVRDGNDVKPPRNLIDLIKYAREAQLRKEDREPRDVSGDPLIEADALRRALSQLSEGRVNDTLLAEAGAYSEDIALFRDGKAEHSLSTLGEIFGTSGSATKARIKPLVELGFLEEIKGTYKIPTLYREGLGITQGKAFNLGEEGDTDDD